MEEQKLKSSAKNVQADQQNASYRPKNCKSSTQEMAAIHEEQVMDKTKKTQYKAFCPL